MTHGETSNKAGATELPMVSVIMPCLNERKYIHICMDSLVNNDYPKEKLEILVIDGMSSDGTREILQEYTRQYPFIRVVDNPEKIKPRALNIGIRDAMGSIIIRTDAHATYASDYISKSVQYLHEYSADNVGGIRKTLPSDNSVMARAISLSISHPFAAGNAAYRTGSRTMRWVDTVFGGCYRKDIFEKLGMFNEKLIRGQDREFNVRLRRSGGRILLAPDILCYYYARGDLADFLAWIFDGGMTPFYISRVVRQVLFSWRNLVPPLFVLSWMCLLALASVWPLFGWLLLAVFSLYVACCLIFSVLIAWQSKDVRFLAAMPLVFVATHTVYGLGALVGLVKPVK